MQQPWQQLSPALPTSRPGAAALPVRELPRDEGADEDPHEEQGGGQRCFPVVLAHQVPLQEKGPCSDAATSSLTQGVIGCRHTHFHSI